MIVVVFFILHATTHSNRICFFLIIFCSIFRNNIPPIVLYMFNGLPLLPTHTTKSPVHATPPRRRKVGYNYKNSLYLNVSLNVHGEMFVLYHTVEPQSERTYLLTCASNEDSNKPMHLHSLIRVFVVHMKILHPWLSKIRLEKILISLRECAGWSESSLGVHGRRDILWCTAQLFEGSPNELDRSASITSFFFLVFFAQAKGTIHIEFYNLYSCPHSCVDLITRNGPSLSEPRHENMIFYHVRSSFIRVSEFALRRFWFCDI